jgi:hypothetical protein
MSVARGVFAMLDREVKTITALSARTKEAKMSSSAALVRRALIRFICLLVLGTVALIMTHCNPATAPRGADRIIHDHIPLNSMQVGQRAFYESVALNDSGELVATGDTIVAVVVDTVDSGFVIQEYSITRHGRSDTLLYSLTTVLGDLFYKWINTDELSPIFEMIAARPGIIKPLPDGTFPGSEFDTTGLPRLDLAEIGRTFCAMKSGYILASSPEAIYGWPLRVAVLDMVPSDGGIEVCIYSPMEGIVTTLEASCRLGGIEGWSRIFPRRGSLTLDKYEAQESIQPGS